MTYQLAIIFSYCIGVPGLLGVIRFKKINPVYYPFLICIWLGCLNELAGYFITRQGHSNAVNNNIYVLAESLLFTWQFRNWGLFRRSRYIFPVLMASLILTWVIEGFFIESIHHTISYFRLIYSFVIVLMSITVINGLLMRERRSILKNPVFLICISFLVYYTFKIIVGAFWLYALSTNMQFMMNLTAILIYINFITNLVFALAILWMPTKHRFSLPS